MPAIAELYATVLPETSKIAAGIVRAFREVDPKAAEAGRRWGREIERGIGEAKVELKADTAKAKAEIDAAAKDKRATVEVKADTAKAKAEISEVARDRKAKVKLDVDQGDLARLSSMLASGNELHARAFSGLLRARRDLATTQFKDPLDFADSIITFQSAGNKLSQSLAGAGSSAAGSVSGALSAAMGPVGGALSTALIAGGVTAAVGVAAALSGAIGLIPAGLAGGVGVVGTLVTGLHGVKDAWDAAGKAADSANKDGAEKAKAVAAAQKSLRDAVLDEAMAQKDVANARKDARQQLEDLNVQMRGGVIDEKQAILDAQSARRDLATGRFKDSIEYEQAQLRVQSADQRVLESHERNVQLQGKVAEGRAKGVEGSDQVVAAEVRLAKAHEQVAAAQQAAAEAQAKASSNQDAFALAMGKISPNARNLITTLQGLKPAWEALRFSVQDKLFAGIGPEIQQLATTFLPVLQTAMGNLATTMNTAFKDFGTWVSKPETMAALQQIIANIGSSFQLWAKSLEPFSNAFLTITKVGSGFLPGLAKMITDGANAFNNFIQNASRTGELQQWMQLGIDTMRELMRLVPILGKLFYDLAPLALPSLQLIGGVLRELEPVFAPIISALASMTGFLAQHPTLITAVVAAFATWKTITAVSAVLTALQGISAALKLLPAEATAAGTGMAAGLGPILATLTTAATALALWNSHGDSAPTNIGPGASERQRKLDAGKKYADAHGGEVPDGYGQWLDKGGPMPPELGQYYVPGAAPGTPFFDAQGRGLNAQGKPFGGVSAPEPYNPNIPKSAVPGASATAPYADLNWDALAEAEAGGNWANRSNPKYKGGLQLDADTWNAYKPPGAPSDPAAATKEQQIQAATSALAAGRTPQSLWPQNWQTLGPGAGAPPAFPAPTAMASSAPLPLPSASGTGGLNLSTIPIAAQQYANDCIDASARIILSHSGVNMTEDQLKGVIAPGGTISSQAAGLNSLNPAGRYVPMEGSGGSLQAMFNAIKASIDNGTGSILNVAPGSSLAGRNFADGHFIAVTGYNADGTINLSDTARGTQYSVSAADAFQATRGRGIVAGTGTGPGAVPGLPSPLTSGVSSLPGVSGLPSAGMPTIAAPGGVSPDGIPLGTQNSPMYVTPTGPSGQQLGQDIFDGFLEIFGIDGSVFKNPFNSGLFKGFKGLMHALTGGGKGGQGLPGAAYAAAGVGADNEPAGMPSGGGGPLGLLNGLLPGIAPQPFGEPRIAGGAGGIQAASSAYTPGSPAAPAAVGDVHNDYSIHVGTVKDTARGAFDEATSVNIPRARQNVGTGIPGSG